MPFKANAERRHHIPKQQHRARNSAAYDAALRQRGSLTIWFTDAAIAAWKAQARTTRGGQPGSVASLRIDRLLYDAMTKYGMNDGDRLQGQPLRA